MEQLAPKAELDAQSIIYQLRSVLYETAKQLQDAGGLTDDRKDRVNHALMRSYDLPRTNVQSFLRRYVEPWTEPGT